MRKKNNSERKHSEGGRGGGRRAGQGSGEQAAGWERDGEGKSLPLEAGFCFHAEEETVFVIQSLE